MNIVLIICQKSCNNIALLLGRVSARRSLDAGGSVWLCCYIIGYC